MNFYSVVLSPDNVKRIDQRQCAEVKALERRNTNTLFGNFTAVEQLTYSFLSLGLYTEEGDLASAMCLDSYPNVPSVPSWEWAHWLNNLYNISDLSPRNTAWLHYAVWQKSYTHFFFRPMMQHYFHTYEHIEFVVFVCPPGIVKVNFLEDHARREYPTHHMYTVQTLYVCQRSTFTPQYIIRKAVEEDNDDLVAIIPKSFEETYGSYYISELVNFKDEVTRQVIVAEHGGCAVGVLCLNSTINYELLDTNFELVAFHGLRKPNDADEIGSFELNERIDTDEILSARDSFCSNTIDYREKELEKDKEKESSHSLAVIPDHDQDSLSDDEYSLEHISSSIIFNLYYQPESGDDPPDDDTVFDDDFSFDSTYSSVMLNDEYEDHVYNAVRESSQAQNSHIGAKGVKPLRDLTRHTYYGGSNAFAIEICAALPDYETCLLLLFQASFECFPEREYCIVSFPSDAKYSFKITEYFTKVAERSGSIFNHQLYVLHRSAVLGHLSVQEAIPRDISRVHDLLTLVVKPGIIEEAFRAAIIDEGCTTKAYTFLCDDQIVGCAIISEELEAEYLELHYNIDDWVNTSVGRFGNFGNLDAYILSPIFHKRQSFFMLELHRLSNYYVLYHRVKRNELLHTHKSTAILNSLNAMAPVMPNPPVEYDRAITKDYQLPAVVNKKRQPFALYLTSPRITTMQRIEITTRLVVIGTGITTLSFLESLLFAHNTNCAVTFTSVTVVSPQGLFYPRPPNKIRDAFFVENGKINNRYLDSVCLQTYVNVVAGAMTAINRQDKYVVVNDEQYLPYDYLFLICGRQFQRPPVPSAEVVSGPQRKIEFPINMYVLNTEADVANALMAMRVLRGEKKQGKQCSVVVVGHHLEACCCLAALLEFGLSASRLIYVDPSPAHNPANGRHDHITKFFNNSDVENAVLNEMLQQGITIYQDFNFVNWTVNSLNTITSVKFESKYKFVDIECCAVFMYHSKSVSSRTFQAITTSGLVFNGQLVIDMDYKTNDPNIYGAGSLTQYSAKYYAQHLMHIYHNGEDIGYDLGQRIRKLLIPEQYWEGPVKEPVPPKPLVQHCRFPGNLHYLHITKPGINIPVEVLLNRSPFGKLMVTGDCHKLEQKGYFRLHLNHYNTVETITCLSKSEIHVQSMMSLYGLHESLLNNLCLRYDMKLIPDFYQFFAEPWACAVYHPKFRNLLNDINNLFFQTCTPDGIPLIDHVRKKLEQNEWKALTAIELDELEELCRKDTNFNTIIEKKVLEFLNDHYMYMPMYAHHIFIRWIVHANQTSPLFINILNSPNIEAILRTIGEIECETP